METIEIKPKIKWVSGFGLDVDQSLVITTSNHRQTERYYYNTVRKCFVSVNWLDYFIQSQFDCTKEHLQKAKQAAKKQDLRQSVEILKIRNKI